MPHRGPARLLAPLAIVAFVIALVVVISAGGDHADSRNQSTISESATPTKKSAARKKTSSSAPKYYVVQPNDSFSTIAAKNGVSTDRIQELNPDVDPQLMSIGDKIRLR